MRVGKNLMKSTLVKTKLFSMREEPIYVGIAVALALVTIITKRVKFGIAPQSNKRQTNI